MGGPPGSCLGVGLTTNRHKNDIVTKICADHQMWTDSLDKQPMLWNII
jgi:hypothetical protein